MFPGIDEPVLDDVSEVVLSAAASVLEFVWVVSANTMLVKDAAVMYYLTSNMQYHQLRLAMLVRIVTTFNREEDFIMPDWKHVSEGDKAKTTFGISVPKGTLMVTSQITDVDYYNKLVENGQVGLSIEGFLGLKLSNQIKTNSMLPDGTHTLEDGTVIVIKDGQIVEVQEPMAEEQVMEVEASTEVELADTTEVTEESVKEEEVVEVEAAIDPAADTDAILAIVSPYIEQRISELLQVIADLKNELTETEEVAPVEEIKMTAAQKFNQVIDFLKK